MLHAWQKYGLEDASQEYASKYMTKHRNPNRSPTDFASVVSGKIAFIKQVRGEDSHTYRKLAQEYLTLIGKPVPWTSLRLFYCYSHEDELYRNKLEEHLAVLRRDGIICEWHDRKLMPGADFDDEIAEELSQAEIVLLLVSSSFLASDYCWHKEMLKALEQHKEGTTVVVPIIVRDCDWLKAPFANLLGLPTDGKPIASWQNTDEALADVARGIRRLTCDLKQN